MYRRRTGWDARRCGEGVGLCRATDSVEGVQSKLWVAQRVTSTGDVSLANEGRRRYGAPQRCGTRRGDIGDRAHQCRECGSVVARFGWMCVQLRNPPRARLVIALGRCIGY
jgi:hypothetical protein